MVVCAIAQFAPGEDKSANIATITRLATEARGRGSDLLVLPEYSMFTVPAMDERFLASAEAVDGVFVSQLRDLAKRNSLAIVCGMNEVTDDRSRDPQHTARHRRSGRHRGVVSQTASVRRIRLPRVAVRPARARRTARDLHRRRPQLRPADMLRPAFPRSDTATGRCRCRRRRDTCRVGSRAAQGGPLADAAAGQGDREHHLRGRCGPMRRRGSRKQHDRRPDGNRGRCAG